MLARLFIDLHFAVEIRHFGRPRLAHEPHIFFFQNFQKILKARADIVSRFIELLRAKPICSQNVSRRVG